MYISALIVHIIVSLMLVAVILLQAGKGGGLADTFGGGGGQTTIFGQKASTFLTRATTVSAIAFLCTSLALALLSSRRERSLMENVKVTMPATTTKQVVEQKEISPQPSQTPVAGTETAQTPAAKEES